MENPAPSAARRARKWLVRGFLLLLVVGGGIAVERHKVLADWRTASRESVGIAPDPTEHPEAIIQVYAARAFKWRGYFGVHTWIAAKPTNAGHFTIYEVVGWRAYHGMPVVSADPGVPDRRWFGAAPEIIGERRGDGVDDMIRRLDEAARSYPYQKEYHVWPGPNSNTFTAHLARAVPELDLDLPPTAIGKDYIPGGGLVARAPSGTGYQVSLFGLLGVLVGREEGLEINLLGLTFGVDPMDLAVKLPLAGRLAM